jgi:hypothetical protein
LSAFTIKRKCAIGCAVFLSKRASLLHIKKLGWVPECEEDLGGCIFSSRLAVLSLDHFCQEEEATVTSTMFTSRIQIAFFCIEVTSCNVIHTSQKSLNLEYEFSAQPKP